MLTRRELTRKSPIKRPTLHPIITGKSQASAMAQTVITTQQDALGQASSHTQELGTSLAVLRSARQLSQKRIAASRPAYVVDV